MLSASKVMRFIGCAHSLTLDIQAQKGAEIERAEAAEDLRLLAEQGIQHEAAYLDKLKSDGFSVYEINTAELSPSQAAKETRKALVSGADYIFQATFLEGNWIAYADFLERKNVPSDLGSYSYEVIDTKLKRKLDPKHVLQLVLYSDLLAKLQNTHPEQAHLVLGTGERMSVTLKDVAPCARHAVHVLKNSWPIRGKRKAHQLHPVACAHG